MFESKERPIVIPQSEHGRLAGTLAWLWGNSEFELPSVSRMSFVAGIALHDRGYGFLDTIAIGRTPEPEWLAVTRKGFNLQFPDPLADLITRFHLRRLVRTNHPIAGHALLAEMDAAIAQKLSANRLSEQKLERIDHITDFCDSISFDFCFETPMSGERVVWLRAYGDTQVNLHYEIRGGLIQVHPSPFSVPSYSTFIVGYERERYPEVLKPLIIPIHISSSS